MEITIHRGINQIGGCITEIATEKARILIDLGQNLPDNEGVVNDPFANRESIEALTRHTDAVFYTHYHGDHLGHFAFTPETVPQYIGRTARQVALCKSERLALIPGREALSQQEICRLKQMIPFTARESIEIKDIRVTPWLVSHSAYDAYMFLIEAGGSRILHTGDFRDHGYLGKGLIPTLTKLILPQGKIDFLITEGTMLSRPDEQEKRESDLKREMIKIMKDYKNVFVLCSSTDMERLATFYAANKAMRYRPFVCDDYQINILNIFSESAGKRSSLFRFDNIYPFNPGNKKLVTWMKKEGCCMLVRPTEKYSGYWNFLEEQLNPAETVLIYSMWREYVNPDGKHVKKEYLDFINRFPSIRYLHTSGHASTGCLTEICNLINPTQGIIPIHSEDSSQYSRLAIREELKKKIITTSQTAGHVRVKMKNTP